MALTAEEAIAKCEDDGIRGDLYQQLNSGVKRKTWSEMDRESIGEIGSADLDSPTE